MNTGGSAMVSTTPMAPSQCTGMGEEPKEKVESISRDGEEERRGAMNGDEG